MTDFWLPNIFGTTSYEIEKEGGLNSFFDENGFQSKMLVKNFGSGFVFLTIYLFLIALYSLLAILSIKLQRYNLFIL